MSLVIPKADYWKPYYKNFRYADTFQIRILTKDVKKIVVFQKDIYPSYYVILKDNSTVHIHYNCTKELCGRDTPFYQTCWYENEKTTFWDDPVYINYKIYNFKIITDFINHIDFEKIPVEKYRDYYEYKK
jgi:hypothetical protein